MLSAGIRCYVPHRPHDLALSIFIESPWRGWHLEGSLDSWIHRLFERYVSTGLIQLDQPVHTTTAEDCAGTMDLTYPMLPLEVAVRRGSAEVACSLVLLGADERQVPDELLSAAAAVEVGAVPMQASIREALMTRRLRQEREAPKGTAQPRRGAI
jgi:hypothetical protein